MTNTTKAVRAEWRDLKPAEKDAVVRDLGRQSLTERQIHELTGAPLGTIRTMSHRLGVVLRREKERKAAEMDGEFAVAGTMWSLDEDRRRILIAKRAALNARRTRREQFREATNG